MCLTDELVPTAFKNSVPFLKAIKDALKSAQEKEGTLKVYKRHQKKHWLTRWNTKLTFDF